MVQSPYLVVVFSVLLLLCFAGLNMSASVKSDGAPEADSTTELKGLQFESCDQLTKVSFSGSNQCTVTKPGLSSTARYSQVSGSTQDLLNLISGSMKRKEVWYHSDTAGIVGDDKVRLYRSNAPELSIVKKMWWYADFAQQYFKEAKLYPSDSEKCKQSDKNFQYLNPLTLKPDCAAIILQKSPGPDMTDAKRGEHERHWRPYGIYCVCLNYQGFAVHGFDRFGRQLTSSDSNRYFTIECRNGVNVTKADKQGHQTQLLQSNSQVPLRVIVSGKPDFEDTVNWTRRVIPAILWVVFLATLLFSCYNLKVKTHLPVKFFSLAATTIALVCLAGWYACVLQPDENSTKASRF